MLRTILVVVQMTELREAIVNLLKGEGYAVSALQLDCADPTHNKIVTVAREQLPALILLDSAQLYPSILELCSQLRSYEETVAVPILMLVASDSEISHLLHSNLCINDFVQLPPRYEELLACVHTLLRSGKRRSRHAVAQRNMLRRKIVYPAGQVLEVGNLQIDADHYKVVRNGLPVELRQPLLFDLLLYLVLHRGSVFSRSQLLQAVWGYEQGYNSRTVDVHMRWLREKLEEDPAHPRLLQTIRGVGYCFNG